MESTWTCGKCKRQFDWETDDGVYDFLNLWIEESQHAVDVPLCRGCYMDLLDYVNARDAEPIGEF